jgi:hypothetical protein
MALKGAAFLIFNRLFPRQGHFYRLTVVLLVVFVIRTSATVLYVDQASLSPSAPFTNWLTAATNIQDAVNVAFAGDVVLVTNGVYDSGGVVIYGRETNRVGLSNGILLLSVNGPQVTSIAGSTQTRCAYIGSNSVLSGFTLTNGQAVYNGDYAMEMSGSGAWCEPGGVVTNCVIRGNRLSGSGDGGGCYGGAVYNCTIIENSAGSVSGWGGGASHAMLNNCTLSDNSAGWYGGGAAFCTLINCIIRNNIGRYGGGGAVNSSLSSCTITGNRMTESGASGGGVGWSFGNTSTPVNNCIIYYNMDLYGNANNYSDGSTLNYCCSTPQAAGLGNFVDEPLFLDYSGGDLRLATNSLCINTGGNTYVTSSTDLDGNPRVIANVVDVGAYEYQALLPIPVAPVLQATYTQVVTGFVVFFTGQIGGQPTASRWEFGDGTIISNQLPSAAHSWAAPGNYQVALRGYGESFPDGVTATITIQVTDAAVSYVNPLSTTPVYPYTSWGTAATNIQPAVDAAYVGATVLVSNGVYQTGGRIVFGSQSNRVVVLKPLTLRSVNGPDVTMIKGYQASNATNAASNIRCVYLGNGTALIGFTLTNGGTRSGQNGGGVYCDQAAIMPTISNCVLVGNSASNYGGGVYFGSLFNCRLTGNSAYLGGGAYGSSLDDCILATNRAVGPYGARGGGVYQTASWNCTLVGNSATLGGGGDESQFRNCVLYYNTASVGSNYGNGTLISCCTRPLPSGTGNITNAPLLVDMAAGDFHLESNSPCINSGNNDYVFGDSDLEGNLRITGGTVDIGAYEYQKPTSSLPYAWAQQYGLLTDGSADFSDPDGDGMNNWEEWLAGLDPTNPASVLVLLRPVTANNSNGITLTWRSVSTRTYSLERTTDLSGSAGFVTIEGVRGQNGTTTVTDFTATNAGPYFYRVRVWKQN